VLTRVCRLHAARDGERTGWVNPSRGRSVEVAADHPRDAQIAGQCREAIQRLPPRPGIAARQVRAPDTELGARYYNVVQADVDPGSERLDYDVLARLATQHQPRLIGIGTSSYSRWCDQAPTAIRESNVVFQKARIGQSEESFADGASRLVADALRPAFGRPRLAASGFCGSPKWSTIRSTIAPGSAGRYHRWLSSC
jgi:hypothetical protein